MSVFCWVTIFSFCSDVGTNCINCFYICLPLYYKFSYYVTTVTCPWSTSFCITLSLFSDSSAIRCIRLFLLFPFVWTSCTGAYNDTVKKYCGSNGGRQEKQKRKPFYSVQVTNSQCSLTEFSTITCLETCKYQGIWQLSGKFQGIDQWLAECRRSVGGNSCQGKNCITNWSWAIPVFSRLCRPPCVTFLRILLLSKSLLTFL